MRRTITENYVLVLGRIWMPAVIGSTRYDLSDYDIENIGEFTRENVARWLSTHAGDFQSVQDFYATVGDEEIRWETSDGEMAYLDTLPRLESIYGK